MLVSTNSCVSGVTKTNYKGEQTMPKFYVQYKAKFTGAIYTRYFDSMAFAMKFQMSLNKEIYNNIKGGIIYDE